MCKYITYPIMFILYRQSATLNHVDFSKIELHKTKKRHSKYRRGDVLQPRLFTSEYPHNTAQKECSPPVSYPYTEIWSGSV